MNRARWIWLKGDFEIYHSLLLHGRREEFGVPYPPMWHCATPYPCVKFCKTVSFAADTEVFVHAKGFGYVRIEHEKYPIEKRILLPKGNYELQIVMMATDGSFPCIFIDGKDLITDETWTCNHVTEEVFPVGSMPEYSDPEDDPRVFKFCYEPLIPVAERDTEEGKIFDFGKETFGRIRISGAKKNEVYTVVYGESEEEALDEENAVIVLPLSGQTDYDLSGRAFRFVQIKGATAGLSVRADYEYLPLKDRASFSCDVPEIQKIWEVCAYTFHLNSREFFLDGIKRDRWVWSGDAYQSYMANNYLYFDPAITKRTILALLGKPPYEQHVNTINDYTMYLILAVEEYYQNTGDLEFIRFVWKRIRALYGFLASRADEKGYICKRPGDWIFIDWSQMDKSGNLCAEQILFWKTKLSMAVLAELLNEDGDSYRNEAEILRNQILADYWNEEKKAFIDCYSSGRNNVTRHANIFAILYDFVDKSRMNSIMEHVLENDAITHITTPYFEFFELMAYGKMGRLEHIQEKIKSYWGGIVALGGTSIWEQFDPAKSGIEHYEMYGKKFGCSLCHAWGSGPIYLLGRYCIGVFPTDVGYKTFCVEPNPGNYQSFEGAVPLPEGEVSVRYRDGALTVCAGAEGGTLKWKGKEYPLQKDLPLTVN